VQQPRELNVTPVVEKGAVVLVEINASDVLEAKPVDER